MKRSVKKIKQKEAEQELWVNGIFVSEQDMKEMKVPEHRRKAIKDECALNKGWIRQGVGTKAS